MELGISNSGGPKSKEAQVIKAKFINAWKQMEMPKNVTRQRKQIIKTAQIK